MTMAAGGKKRPVPLAEEPIQKKRRSMSAASRDTTAANSPIEPAAPQYAPIDTYSYQPQADHAPMVAPNDASLSNEHAQLAQIRQFNNSYAAHDEQPQYNLTNGNHQDVSAQTGHESGPQANEYPATTAQPQQQHRTLQRTMSMNLDGAGDTGTENEKKGKKVVNNNAANEKELRELIETNSHRSLESIARDVRNAERTQKAEKAKQLFAMRWLKQYCKRDTDSVPRARVYTYYAQRCGNDRVDTLNPASFGKLVRIIFPGIQTRRLGVRGESKYHYVSLALIEDPLPSAVPPMSARMSVGSERGTPVEADASFRNSARIPADSASFPQHEQSFTQPPIATSANPASQSHLFADNAYSGYGHHNTGRSMYKQKLCFSHLNDRPSSDEPLRDKVPSLNKYVPAGFDGEQVQGLFELYVAHCTSLVDAARYVKERQFIKLIGTFNGTMTVPVAKLFQQPSVAPWIRECDRVMYQQIIMFVSQLVLQVLPQPVFLMLRNLGSDLTEHIKKHFYHYPPHVLEAKLEMATVFCSLLQRLLRVNETAHAAANLLMKDDMRTVMWHDWVTSVRPKRVVESALSRCGHEDAYNVLTADMRLLLAPLPPPGSLDEPPEFQATAATIDAEALDWETYATADSIMERWSAFLKKLPSRFPDVPTRNLLHCIESVGNAALRDITVNVAQSFGAWWTTKVWLDEMMLWLAEMGGFLDSGSPSPSPTSQEFNEDYESVLVRSLHDAQGNGQISRPATASQLPRPNSAHPALDFTGLPSFSPNTNGHRHSSGPPTATFKFGVTPKPGDKHSHISPEEFEDSGIGMSLLDGAGSSFSFSPFKFGALTGENYVGGQHTGRSSV